MIADRRNRGDQVGYEIKREQVKVITLNDRLIELKTLMNVNGPIMVLNTLKQTLTIKTDDKRP